MPDSTEAEANAWDAVKGVPARSAHQLGFLAGVEWAEENGDASMAKFFVDQQWAVSDERETSR